ncbi:MAG: hypothetical protein ACK5T0_09315 [Vampirovibrionales bacterium]
MMNMFNIQPQQYLPSSPSGNTVQVMNTVTVANNAAAQFGSLSDIMGQALTNDLLENFTRINNEGKGIKISLKDIKGDARYLSKLTPAMAVAAGLTITDDFGNTVIGAAPKQQMMMMAPQQQQMMMAPQQQQMMMAPQQQVMPQQQPMMAPQQPQQMNQQQQFAVTMMQELKKMQAQINQPAPAPAPTNTSFSQNSSPVNSWASVSNDPSDYWDPSQGTTSSTSSPSQNSSDDGVLDFWGNPTSSRSTSSSSSSSPNPFFDVGASTATQKPTTTQNSSSTSSNTAIQAQMNQMMQMMQMMMQGTMPQQQTMMPQQQMMYAPQPQMTLMDFKVMQAGTQMVVNAPQQRAPQQSALTQRVMENFQNSSSDSMSF